MFTRLVRESTSARRSTATRAALPVHGGVGAFERLRAHRAAIAGILRPAAALHGGRPAVQLESDPSPPPELAERLTGQVQAPASGGGDGGEVPDTGEGVDSIEAGVGPPGPAEEGEAVQASPADPSRAPAPPRGDPAAVLTGGEPLRPADRGRMSRFFGHDFGGVRVHADGRAGALARSLHAHAFTAGHHIAFAAGRYRPGTRDGDRLLAHELTHVVQQSRGLRGDILRAGIGAPGDAYERAADDNADRFVAGHGRASTDSTGSAGPTPGSPERPPERSIVQLYSASAAAAYARKWALSTNPAFPRMGNDCTNFVSQAMLAGGWAMVVGSRCDDRKKSSVWWYKRNGCTRWIRSNIHASHTWGGAENFYHFVKSSGRGSHAASVGDLSVGDVLQMAFSGQGDHIGHTMIVTKKDNSNLYLSYHTTDHLDEPFWGTGGIRDRNAGAKYFGWKM